MINLLKYIKCKLKVFEYWFWYVVIIKRDRNHWDLDRSVWWRYGWQSNTRRIHDELHFKFRICQRIFD
jgi:hypothetical protein